MKRNFCKINTACDYELLPTKCILFGKHKHSKERNKIACSKIGWLANGNAAIYVSPLCVQSSCEGL